MCCTTDRAFDIDGITDVTNAEHSENVSSRATRRRALVIEDDEIYRELVAAMLTRDGWEVDAAWDGQVGWQMAQLRDYELVVTDIIMPHQEGLETIRLLRAYRPTLPIVAMSGGGVLQSDHYLRMARWFGADQTLEKPFDAAALHAAVDGSSRTRAVFAANAAGVVLDRELFSKLHEALNPDSLRRLAEGFIAETEQRLSRLRIAASHSNRQVARDEAHALKSGAALFGLTGLAEASEELETVAVQGGRLLPSVLAVGAAAEPAFHNLRAAIG
jgi:DNA-binding response OmpR family regulator